LNESGNGICITQFAFEVARQLACADATACVAVIMCAPGQIELLIYPLNAISAALGKARAGTCR
jgi:hypothetical protein